MSMYTKIAAHRAQREYGLGWQLAKIAADGAYTMGPTAPLPYERPFSMGPASTKVLDEKFGPIPPADKPLPAPAPAHGAATGHVAPEHVAAPAAPAASGSNRRRAAAAGAAIAAAAAAAAGGRAVHRRAVAKREAAAAEAARAAEALQHAEARSKLHRNIALGGGLTVGGLLAAKGLSNLLHRSDDDRR